MIYFRGKSISTLRTVYGSICKILSPYDAQIGVVGDDHVSMQQVFVCTIEVSLGETDDNGNLIYLKQKEEL